MDSPKPHPTPTPPTRRGMQLDRVVLLGRTFDEYRRYFDLNPDTLRGLRILDVAGGVSSFTAEAAQRGLHATAADPIYALPPTTIEERSGPDLDHVFKIVHGLPTYKWDFYRDPHHMRSLRDQARTTFLKDFRGAPPGRYIPATLPTLPFQSGHFDLTLVSYLLLVYEDQFDSDFHIRSVRELMRVTRGEARIYPTVSFEAKPSLHLEAIRGAPELTHLEFEIIPTNFEFLLGSNSYLRIRHRQG